MRTLFSVSITNPDTWGQIDTDFDVAENHIAASVKVAGVVRAYRADRYQIKFEVGRCFNMMDVATAIREAVEEVETNQ